MGRAASPRTMGGPQGALPLVLHGDGVLPKDLFQVLIVEGIVAIDKLRCYCDYPKMNPHEV